MLFVKPGVVSKEKEAVSSREMAGGFCLPPAVVKTLLSSLIFLLGTLRIFVGDRNGKQAGLGSKPTTLLVPHAFL